MIQEKQGLSGNLNVKQSLNGSLNNSVIYVDPITQEKEVTPTKEIQEIKPDIGYTGLSKVIVDGYKLNVRTKTITQNGTYKAEDDNLDGYSEVEVDAGKYAPKCISFYQCPNVDLTYEIENLDINNMTSLAFMFYYSKLTSLNLKGFVKSNISSLASMFSNSNSLKTINMSEWDVSNVTDISHIFNNCSQLLNVDDFSKLKFSKLKNINGMFNGCQALTGELIVPEMDISECTDFTNIFNSCYVSKITNIENWNTSNVTNMMQSFGGCYNLEKLDISNWNTSNVTSMYQTFSSCRKLTDLSEINCLKVDLPGFMFNSCTELTNFGGLKDLGNGFSTSLSANSRKLDLSSSTKLTEQSLINVLNKLYDIATKGCKTQQVVLGSTNLAKLTSEEGQQALENATAKGWTIS